MKQGYDNQLTRQIGEHTVVAKLGRFGILATPFAGNVPNIDLIASDISGHSLPIQVKAINGPSWQFSATSFLDIEFKGDRQVIKGKKNLANPNLIYVLVLIKSEGADDFYVLTLKDLQEYFYKNYKGGIRPRNPESTHCAIWPKDISKYKDKWKKVIQHFDVIKKETHS